MRCPGSHTGHRVAAKSFLNPPFPPRTMPSDTHPPDADPPGDIAPWLGGSPAHNTLQVSFIMTRRSRGNRSSKNKCEPCPFQTSRRYKAFKAESTTITQSSRRNLCTRTPGPQNRDACNAQPLASRDPQSFMKTGGSLNLYFAPGPANHVAGPEIRLLIGLITYPGSQQRVRSEPV